MQASELVKTSGIFGYRNYYPRDPHLNFWSGLAHLGNESYSEAISHFNFALENGFSDLRIHHYLAECAEANWQCRTAQRITSQDTGASSSTNLRWARDIGGTCVFLGKLAGTSLLVKRRECYGFFFEFVPN